MDRKTLGLLEFGKIRELVAGYASSTLGKDLARALAPRTDIAQTREELAQTSEMVEALDTQLIPPLQGLRDVRTWVRRAGLGVLLEADPLLEIRAVAELTGRVFDYCNRLGPDYPQLELLLAAVPDLRHLAKAIAAVIDDRGRVHDSADPELARIRAELARYEERIQTELRRLLRSPEVRDALRYPSATVSGTHHVLPVAVNHRHKVAGVVHRTSSSGETVYIEPAKVAALSAEATLLQSAEQRILRKVFRRLTTLVGRESQALSTSLERLAELDLLHAKACYSRAFAMTSPELDPGGKLELFAARHPLLQELFRRPGKPGSDTDDDRPTEVVPIDVHLGTHFDLLIITGPNTGGKTVALKTVGLICVMALSGLHVPARAGSRVPWLRDVLADIGDEQSLEQSLSTFSSHITRIAEILRHGSRDTLILLDELGAGTEPSEGAALGRAILDELVRIGCLAMVTTHLGDLKTYALGSARAENGAVEFDAQTLRPTFHLVIGRYGQSCALKIARRLKLPRRLLDRANRYFRRRGGRARELDRLQELRGEAEAARSQASAAQAAAEQAADEYRRKAENLQQEANVSAELQKFRATLRSGDRVRVARFAKSGTVVRVDQQRGKVTLTVGAVEWELPLEEVLPVPAN